LENPMDAIDPIEIEFLASYNGKGGKIGYVD
jgi:hypothetical protein